LRARDKLARRDRVASLKFDPRFMVRRGRGIRDTGVL
jgi:hypothetical protein